MSELKNKIKEAGHLKVKQIFEAWEFAGVETRNKYRIHSDTQENLAYAAEESSGFAGTILRLIFKHWRSFKVTIFDQNRMPVYTLQFPFRWFFKTLIVSEVSGRRIGHLQQRFAIFRKKFDVYDVNGKLIANINSGFFKFWTFDFEDHGRLTAKIQKQWGGVLTEAFTDKDTFLLSFTDKNLPEDTKALMLSMCLLVDIVYFENNKASPLDLLDFGS